jgi:DNA-directed RNA polymerase specialized sigma24 family protein
MDSLQEEFLALTRQYRGVIVSAIRRVCGDASPTVLPDVEQEVYLALWQRWNSDARIDYPVSYLYKVALRTALAVMRTYSTPGSEEAATQPSLPMAQCVAGEDLSPLEGVYVLTELLDQLPPEQARAVRAYLAGFSHTETATLYGWSVAVGRHRIYRGLQALKALMMQESV